MSVAEALPSKCNNHEKEIKRQKIDCFKIYYLYFVLSETRYLYNSLLVFICFTQIVMVRPVQRGVQNCYFSFYFFIFLDKDKEYTLLCHKLNPIYTSTHFYKSIFSLSVKQVKTMHFHVQEVLCYCQCTTDISNWVLSNVWPSLQTTIFIGTDKPFKTI